MHSGVHSFWHPVSWVWGNAPLHKHHHQVRTRKFHSLAPLPKATSPPLLQTNVLSTFTPE